MSLGMGVDVLLFGLRNTPAVGRLVCPAAVRAHSSHHTGGDANDLKLGDIRGFRRHHSSRHCMLRRRLHPGLSLLLAKS